MSEANVELARLGYARWSAGDVEGLIELSTPDFEFVPAIAAGVEGGSVKGPDEFRRFFMGLNETWETFRIEADDFRDLGDGVMTSGRLIARGRGSEVELDHPIYSVIWIRDGRFARMQSFLDQDSAEAAATGHAENEARR
jgi:ketosteroid isomerase-like protein